jgi:pyridoxamine 5'-phosphate oxidase
MDIAKIRTDYSQKTLDITDVQTDPVEQFKIWLQEALDSAINEPTAMVLSTAANNIPSSRVVLLKDIKEGGFVFFTNYSSHKGNEMAQNQHVALNFFWPELERQVRIVGKVKKTSEGLSEQYFNSRPANSRVGAWSSPQSSIIPNRAWLEDKEKELTIKFKDQEIPRPAHWGGYVVEPTLVEFWQGRPSRLHDRIQYSLDSNKGWLINRLAP